MTTIRTRITILFLLLCAAILPPAHAQPALPLSACVPAAPPNDRAQALCAERKAWIAANWSTWTKVQP